MFWVGTISHDNPLGSTHALAFDRSSTVRGQLFAQNFTTISSEIAGKLSIVQVKDGDRFLAGDLLIALDCAIQQAQHDEALAVLRAAMATRQVNQRLRELNSAGNLEIELAIAEEAKAQARVNATRTILSKCQLQAPFNGKVADLKVRALQYVQPGQPLVDLVDDTGFEIELFVPSRWLRWLKTGQEFSILIEETGKSYSANLTRIGGRVDPVSETVRIYGSLIDPTSDLVPGMSGIVKFD